MSSTIYSMLNTATSALITQQKALDVTANNIANVNTEGYSRQRLNIEQNGTINYEGGTLNAGVQTTSSIQRIYDRFINSQIADALAQEGRWEAQQETLEKAELMFDDASGYGLNSAMGDFFSSWQEVANNPSGFTERATLLADAQAMTEVFNKLDSDLRQVQADSDVSIAGTVEDINTLSGEIADLNLKIAEVESGSEHIANEFRDQRDLKLKELSELIDVNSFEDDNGYLTINTANGHNLVEGARSWNLITDSNADGFQDVFWESSSGTLNNITDDISTGKLKGWIEARNEINGYLSRLDEMAKGLAVAVNEQHAKGLDLNGDRGDTHGTFFVTESGDPITTSTSAEDLAGAIKVNTLITDDTNLVAAALYDSDLSIFESPPGGNSNAIAMANIQNSLVMSGNTSTMDDYYNSLVSDAGRFVSQASANAEHQSTVSLQLETYRAEVSGVSLDEEMVNLVQFQSAYAAAAKLVTAADEMLQTVIGLV
jgi:flagellar hook-associated protein 1 FlgK